MIDRNIQPLIREPQLSTVPSPEKRVMRNGIPLYILSGGDHEVVRIDFVIRAGRWFQTQHLQALFTNRMLREGTRKYAASEIAEKLDYYGAWLELSCSSEHSYITLYSLCKYLPETLDILESIIKEPLFPDKELQIVIENNLQQYHINRTKVDFLAHRSLMRNVYGEYHPCGQVTEENDYRTITPLVLNDFYKRYYNSGNCSIYLAGKVDEDTIKRVSSLFGDESFGEDFKPIDRKEYIVETNSEKRIFIERSDAMQSAVRMGMQSLDILHPDYLKFRVVVTLLGGYFGSRLMSNIREDKGYTYGISASIQTYPGSSLFVITTEAANEFVEPLIKEVYHEITRLQSDLVPDEELSMVKNYMMGEMCRNYESVFSLVDAWIFNHSFGLPDSYAEDSARAIETITPAYIRDLAQQYLCKDTLKEVVSGKKIL